MGRLPLLSVLLLAHACVPGRGWRRVHLRWQPGLIAGRRVERADSGCDELDEEGSAPSPATQTIVLLSAARCCTAPSTQ